MSITYPKVCQSIHGKYYIDFSEVRGSDLVRELKRTITFSDQEPTCQLFTGHIGCGKSSLESSLRINPGLGQHCPQTGVEDGEDGFARRLKIHI